MITIVLVLAGLALIGYVLVSRWRGQVLNIRRTVMLPAIVTAVGLVQVVGLARHGARMADLVLVGAGVVLSAALGAARGGTVALWVRDGQPWLRYRPATLWLWAATFAMRLALTALAYAFGAAMAASGPAILLSVGTTLLAEGAIVARRAFSAGDVEWQARTRRQSAATR